MRSAAKCWADEAQPNATIPVAFQKPYLGTEGFFRLARREEAT